MLIHAHISNEYGWLRDVQQMALVSLKSPVFRVSHYFGNDW